MRRRFLGVALLALVLALPGVSGAVTPCAGDFDGDGDVDALDGETLAADPGLLSAAAFAAEFGRCDCPVTFRGNSLVLIDADASGFGPGAIVFFDVDGDDVYERQVEVDADGRFSIALDVSALPDSSSLQTFTESADGTQTTPVRQIQLERSAGTNLALAVPANLAAGAAEPGISACIADCAGATRASLNGFAHSHTPESHGVELATGKLRQAFPITAFATRLLGFNLELWHASLVAYDGPFGQGVSHSYEMMIVQTGPLSGSIVTPDLRIFPISSADGITWELPTGFYARLVLDTDLDRWTLTHYSGFEVEFFQALSGQPGRPLAIREPNGNTIRLEYDASGRLTRLSTDLDQLQTFGYDAGTGRLASFTDHDTRSWSFTHDGAGHLATISTPATEHASIPADTLLSAATLPGALVTQPRVTALVYGDAAHPTHVTARIDPRGATPMAWGYDGSGRVSQAIINGHPAGFDYAPVASPTPVAPLDPTNPVRRVTDREGNLVDWEILGSGTGAWGVRRVVQWTETGRGNPALRAGEPAYWEQRWLQDCDCLRPSERSQPFASTDPVTFDPGSAMPTDWPRHVFTYNTNRQVLVALYQGATEQIRREYTYQPNGFGDADQYSRRIYHTDPRAFDPNPVYAGLSFVHSYGYDTRGNRETHTAPTVSRGVPGPQTIVTSWSYNAFGQPVSRTAHNGNVTTTSYEGGYVASRTRGDTGSADPLTQLVDRYQVDAHGLVIRHTDPKGFVTDIEYNDLFEPTRVVEPLVTLRHAAQVRYETTLVYDGAGNRVARSRTNLDAEGAPLPNPTVDRFSSYDAIGKLRASRIEVDGNPANDLVTRYAYDRNDQLSIRERPAGNRTFHVYDERRLALRTFYGVAPGALLEDGYPASKTDETLSVGFVGFVRQTYDGRENLVRVRDGRGHLTHYAYDFANRRVAASDPNGNGWVRSYDDASRVLSDEGGSVDPNSGMATSVLERTYFRWDEFGRRYQRVRDLDPTTDEGGAVSPVAAGSASFEITYDPGSRVATRTDANGNTTEYQYDAADRRLQRIDALGNTRTHTYDENSNVVSRTEIDQPGPGAVGASETYVTTYVYDELDRRTERHDLGLDGTSIDHERRYAYDSRHNLVLEEDEEGFFDRFTYDDLDRRLRTERFDGDPLTGTPTLLGHREIVYDANSRVVARIARSTAVDPASEQVTRYAYDDLDRRVRTVYPDSDDPIDGSGDGADAVFDRVETLYDENSNVLTVTDQRGVVFSNLYDPGNRRTDTTLAGVPAGETQREYRYDALDRLTGADNDYASVALGYDALSRRISDTQSVRLDGTGFTGGWEDPVQVNQGFDPQSNRISLFVAGGFPPTPLQTATYDALNRVDTISAAYFDVTIPKPIADYSYLGRDRTQSRDLGNGVRLERTFDAKRRPQTLVWESPSAGPLLGFEYGYDDRNNPLFERLTHDQGLYDAYGYNGRYELTGVAYRSPTGTPGAFSTGFGYDDNRNRIGASIGDPFGAAPNVLDVYTTNAANEYTQIHRDAAVFVPTYDRAGNPTLLPTRPAAAATSVTGTATWDAFGQLFRFAPAGFVEQHYRYDALQRRVAVLTGPSQTPQRRFLYAGREVLREDSADPGSTAASITATPERVYVLGRGIDDPQLVAIDRDGDGQLGGTTPKNQRSTAADQEYYLLARRDGSVMGLSDADDGERMLEYYRYDAHGRPVVLPVIQDPSGRELTPTDLGDNFAAGAEAASTFYGNVYLAKARRWDDETGLYYNRFRYYEPLLGRFVSRDPLGAWRDRDSRGNAYTYAANRPPCRNDPLGLDDEECERRRVRIWVYDGRDANGEPRVVLKEFSGTVASSSADEPDETPGASPVEVPEAGMPETPEAPEALERDPDDLPVEEPTDPDEVDPRDRALEDLRQRASDLRTDCAELEEEADRLERERDEVEEILDLWRAAHLHFGDEARSSESVTGEQHVHVTRVLRRYFGLSGDLDSCRDRLRDQRLWLSMTEKKIEQLVLGGEPPEEGILEELERRLVAD